MIAPLRESCKSSETIVLQGFACVLLGAVMNISSSFNVLDLVPRASAEYELDLFILSQDFCEQDLKVLCHFDQRFHYRQLAVEEKQV